MSDAGSVGEGFELGGRSWGSRLIVGTGGFRSMSDLESALRESGTEIVTVALRRVDPLAQGSVIDVIDRLGLFVLPNTAGCYTASDAIRTAELAREAFGTDWIKLEVIGDDADPAFRTRRAASTRPSDWSPTASRCCRTLTDDPVLAGGSRRSAARR